MRYLRASLHAARRNRGNIDPSQGFYKGASGSTYQHRLNVYKEEEDVRLRETGPTKEEISQRIRKNMTLLSAK